MKQDKEFIGSAKIVQFQNGGQLTKLSFKKEDLEKMIQIANENNGWFNADLSVSSNGNPYMTVNRWKPTGQAQSQNYHQAPQAQPVPTQPVQQQPQGPVDGADQMADDDDLPF